MRRLLLPLILLVSASTLTAQSEISTVRPRFHPAEARSVPDISSFTVCGTPGMVVLDVLSTETGETQEVGVRRSTPCLTQFAVRAVKDWKFSPATFAGKAIASRMPVAVMFDSPGSAPNPFPLPPMLPQSVAEVRTEFQPAEVTRAGFPPFHPGYTFAQGAVVLEVTLSAKGEAEDINVLRDLPPFTAYAKVVVGDWRFVPATLSGHPVRSKILLAFVSPLVSTGQ